MKGAGESKAGKSLGWDETQSGETYAYMGGYRIVNNDHDSTQRRYSGDKIRMRGLVLW